MDDWSEEERQQFFRVFDRPSGPPQPPAPIRGDEPAQGRPRRHRISRRHPCSVDQFVYFIQASTGQIKIGAAHRPLARLGELQVAHPEPLTLLGTCAGGAPLEESLHREFTTDWIRGEWFRCSERLMARIRDLITPAQ